MRGPTGAHDPASTPGPTGAHNPASTPGPTDAPFPSDFLWGAATSAYQVEGSPLADGAGVSNWHRFAHTPGMTAGGDTGDVACDHYRRFADDVAVMKSLGLNSYRFSLAWNRILPAGRGTVNAAGLDFYSRLVDTLLAAGITPNVTLHHWDLPAALDEQGGWLNRDSPTWFADYARIAFRALGDRVKMWATLNEPWVIVDGGYLFGAHAPGHRSAFEATRVAHNLLRAHGAGLVALRAEGTGRFGVVVNIEPKDAFSDSPEDRAAVARADASMNRHYLDPIFGRGYPAELAEVYGEAWPEFPAAELKEIAQPLDWLGVNYYTRSVVKNDPTAWPVRAGRVRQENAVYTETDWEVHPESLTQLLTWIHERYGDVPLYISENGAAFADPPRAEGNRVQDPLRIDYFRTHLRACVDAMRAGVNLRGYFAWSLLDNFEWAAGYAKRFGIVHVDYETQKRTIKESGLFYRDVIRSGGGVLYPGNETA